MAYERSEETPARLGFERRILLCAGGAVVPAMTTTAILVWTSDLSVVTRWTILFMPLLLTAFALSRAESVLEDRDNQCQDNH